MAIVNAAALLKVRRKVAPRWAVKRPGEIEAREMTGGPLCLTNSCVVDAGLATGADSAGSA
jgi:hypothetical protein